MYPLLIESIHSFTYRHVFPQTFRTWKFPNLEIFALELGIRSLVSNFKGYRLVQSWFIKKFYLARLIINFKLFPFWLRLMNAFPWKLCTQRKSKINSLLFDCSIKIFMPANFPVCLKHQVIACFIIGQKPQCAT